MIVASTTILPDAESLNLHLSHPTSEEYIEIWSHTATSWKDALTIPLYIKEAQYLTTVSLARDGGMTTWVLIDKNPPPNERQIFCSFETFRRRSLISDERGNVEEKYRGRGYGTRHMRELAKVLPRWQSEHGKSIGSVLYSDIGKECYTRLGWLPNPGIVTLPSGLFSWTSQCQCKYSSSRI